MKNINKYNLFKVIIVSCLLLILFSCENNNQKQSPNIILILTDDQGFGDIRSHGNELIDTPNMDKIAESGARFSNFYVSPVCAPTRASLLTGRYHLRTGTQWVTYGLENMRSEEVTIAEYVKKAGYSTGLFGKWHNGSHFPMDPIGQGFDTFFGFTSGHINNYFNTDLEYNGNTVKTKGFISDVLTDSALSFIEKNQEIPFFAYLSYNAPHSPFQVPDEYFNKYKNRGLSNKNASVYGMVENIDTNIGRILKKINDLNLDDNTIIVFLTDNGPNGGDRYNAHMKGFKAKVDEGGIHVPFFIMWKNKIIPGSVIQQIGAHSDVLPTILELAGISTNFEKPLDGMSLAPYLSNPKKETNNRLIFTHQSRWDSLEKFPSSVRDERYLAVNYGKSWELFDMKVDPFQNVDISNKSPQILGEFSKAYDEWFHEVTQNLVGRTPIPVGFEQAKKVTLPAVESYFSGNVKFFGEFGWSNDWLMNWNAPSDTIFWEIDVVKEAFYEFSLSYSLSGNSKSNSFSLITNTETISVKNIPTFIPKTIPSPDRVPRSEVYEQTWGSYSIGKVKLKKGNQKLILTNLKTSTQSTIDVFNLKISN